MLPAHGLAPFLGLLLERARQAEAGENWLFFWDARPGRSVLPHELSRMVAQENCASEWPSRRRMSKPARPMRWAAACWFLNLASGITSREWLKEEMLMAVAITSERDRGGLGAYFYVCGRTGFAKR